MLFGLCGEGQAASCDPSKQTIADCRQQISDALNEQIDNTAQIRELAADQIPDARRDLRVVTTGDVSLNAFGTSVSLNDLLPLFNLAVDPVTSNSDAQSASITLEYSPTHEVLGGDFKLGLIAKTPTVSEAARQAIGDANVVSEIESQYDYADDIEVALTYSYLGNLAGRRIGRSDEFYDGLMNGMLAAADTAATADIDPLAVRQFFGKLFQDIFKPYPDNRESEIQTAINQKTIDELRHFLFNESVAVFSDSNALARFTEELESRSTDDRPLGAAFSSCRGELGNLLVADTDVRVEAVARDYSTCIVDGIVKAIEVGTAQHVARTAAYNQFLKSNGFFKLASLINNQPQLLLSGKAQNRDELAGGDNYSAKLSFEFDLSGHNINNLDRYLRNQSCARNAVDGRLTMAIYESCAREIGLYATDNPVESGGWRGSLNIEYLLRDSADVNLPGSMTPFVLEGGRSLIASFVAGRQFQLLDISNLPKGKLDISVSYDDVSGDPDRQSRALGTVVFTQQLSRATQLSVGFVWANKPEFRGNVDEEITARIGLNYKFAGVGTNE
jgi:hypothetical protein